MSLRTGMAWMFGGQAAFAGGQWLILVLLAKLLGAESVGQFALALGITAPVFALASLRLRTVQATDHDNQFLFCDYFGFTLLSSGLFWIALLPILAVGRWSETGVLVWLIGTAKVFENLSEIAQGLMQKNEEYRLVSYSQIIKAGLGVLAVAICAGLGANIVLAAIGLVIARVVSTIAYDLFVVRRLLTETEIPDNCAIMRLRWANMRSIALLAYPIGILFSLNTLQQSVPRFVIAYHLSERALGFYAAAEYTVVALRLVINAMAQTILPRLARYYTQARSAYLRLLGKALALAFGLSGVAIVLVWEFGAELLSALYTPEYAKYDDVLLCVFFAGALQFIGAVLGTGLTAARSFMYQAIVAMLITGLLCATSYVLTAAMGLIGAALGVAAANAVKVLLSSVQVISLYGRSEERSSRAP